MQITYGFRKVRAVDVGNEAEDRIPLAVKLERLICHNRPKIGTADSDIDYTPNAFSRVTCPSACTDAVGKFRHPVQHGMNFRNDVLSVHRNGSMFGSP